MKEVKYLGKDIQLEDDDLLKSNMTLIVIDEAIIDGVEAYEVKCDFWETTYWLEKNLFNGNKGQFMSDGTKSEYTKTGKKVKSINSYRADLTYNKVYDVFIDNKGDEFIIDDVGDKRYWSISDDDYYELVDDVANTVDTTNDINDNTKTKPKFKVGDKVMVVNTDYISTYDVGVRVGDIGTVIESWVDKYLVKFEGTGYDCDWWFTDKCIELVYDDADVEYNPTEKTHIVSDGGSSSYYAQQIPKGMLERFNTTGIIEAKDVIRLFLGNDFNMGNIFKAYCRVISLRNGKGKAGVDEEYDLTKAKYFTEDELNYYLENTNV